MTTTTEQRLANLEKQVSRHKKFNILLSVFVCVIVTAGAVQDRRPRDVVFRTIKCDSIKATNSVWIESKQKNRNCSTFISALGMQVKNPSSTARVTPSSIGLHAPKGPCSVAMTKSEYGLGTLQISNEKGTVGVKLSGGNRHKSGGEIRVYNRTKELVSYASADQYGNGLVGAYNRKGKGRELKPAQ